MNDLRNYLRAAAADPPPTTIDLDALLRGEQRRSRQLRIGGTLFGVATAAAAIALGMTLLSGDPTPTWGPAGGGQVAEPDNITRIVDGDSAPCGVVLVRLLNRDTGKPIPTGSYPPPIRGLPVEDPVSAAQRLSTAILAEQSSIFPTGATVTDMFHAGCPSLQFVVDPDQDEYWLRVKISGDSAPRGSVLIKVIPAWSGLGPCTIFGDDRCTETALGTATVGTLTQTNQSAKITGGKDSAAVAVRADGTAVTAWAINTDEHDEVVGASSPLTTDQLLTLVTLPALTLYPIP